MSGGWARAARVLAAIAGAVVLAVLAGLLWLASLFEEAGARPIASLAAELGGERWLCVIAHPDDEIMIAGAVADATARGVAVHVASATRGEKGTPDVAVEGPEGLARVRVAELEEHARALAMAPPVVWSLPDREVDRHPNEATARVAGEIERLDPDVVLTFHPASGFTHHPDHRAIGAATVRAHALTRSRARLVFAVAPRGVMSALGGDPGGQVAVLQPEPTWAMPIDPAVKLRGWSIHASQAGYLRRAWKVPPRVLYRFFDEEHYLDAGASR